MIDAQCIEAGNEETLLMGLAAAGALHHLKQDYLSDFWHREDLQLIILCGSGNNGGDGLALASLLCADPDRPSQAHTRHRLRLYGLPPKSKTSRFYLEKLQRQGLTVRPLEDFPKEAASLEASFKTPSFETSSSPEQRVVVVEAMLGTGQSRPPGGIIGQALQVLRRWKEEAKATLVALDVPAGLLEAEGLAEEAILPDRVYTFGYEKTVTALLPGLSVIRIPCGFESQIEETVTARAPVFRCQPDRQFSDIFRRQNSDHKYTAGYGWIVGGQYGMEGAALLAMKAFLASGGGYIRHFHPTPSSRERYLAVLPSVVYGTDFKQACKTEKPPQSILIGPGMQAETLQSMQEDLLEGLNVLSQRSPGLTVILDAAACSLAFDQRFPSVPVLITPHAGEWQSLGGPPVRSADDLEKARRFSGRVHTYLKGPVSFLFSPDAVDVFNDPQPSLAVAGSGDVFGGLLLRATSTARKGPGIRDAVSACFALQHRAAVHTMHPEQQLKAIQEILA